MMCPITPESFQRLYRFDPSLARCVAGCLNGKNDRLTPDAAAQLEETALEALAVEIHYGKALTLGMARLMGAVAEADLADYRRRVAAAAQNGPTLARIMAEHLVAVIKCQDPRLLTLFERAVAAMISKGVYTLHPPLETLSALLTQDNPDSARAFLQLLIALHGHRLSYNRTRQLTHTLPRAVLALPPSRRTWQTAALTRLVKVDHLLIEPYLEGLAAGLDLLHETALKRFVAQALARYRRQPLEGRQFLALESQMGRSACEELQVTAALKQLHHRLMRYCRARTSTAVTIATTVSLPESVQADLSPPPLAAAHRRGLFLAPEIGRLSSRDQNEALYRYLTKSEIGLLEFGTFDFDLDKALDLIQPGERLLPQDAAASPEQERKERSPENGTDPACPTAAVPGDGPSPRRNDLEAFFARFEFPQLADDLFQIAEYGRLHQLTRQHYPGIQRQYKTLVQDEYQRLRQSSQGGHPLLDLYGRIALGLTAQELTSAAAESQVDLSVLTEAFGRIMARGRQVECSAQWAWIAYARLAPTLAGPGFKDQPSTYLRMPTPFGCRVIPALFSLNPGPHEQLAARLKALLAGHGIKVYRSDLKKRLDQQEGVLQETDIRALAVYAAGGRNGQDFRPDLSWLDLDAVLGQTTLASHFDDSTAMDAYRYPEWDQRIEDYLAEHTCVREQLLSDAGIDFYKTVLQRRMGLALRIRRAFEMIKPQQLTLLRQWREGDEFDYRALLDFAVDRRAGLIPSDRLFVKRLKRQRDVAVLLLVDLSRSTANPVADTHTTVLDVEKEAIVLFCEALSVLGDRFAIDGFSGTGRLGVDYLPIKPFDMDMHETVKGRIGAMAPMRGTRMGAAIRHATQRLAGESARIRLLIVLGDGFPNDLEYKTTYAVADTRKAVMEARSRSIHVKAITVNLGADPKLDDLYGSRHHTVISDVRELPDRLVKIYSRLTRT
jgi:nitric oxide reductase NorD protein